MFNYKEYTPCGVRAVDAVVACVYAHRKLNKPLKALHLKPQAYNQFEHYFAKLRQNDDDGFLFDGVNIERGSVLQVADILPEFYALEV